MIYDNIFLVPWVSIFFLKFLNGNLLPQENKTVFIFSVWGSLRMEIHWQMEPKQMEIPTIQNRISKIQYSKKCEKTKQ